MKRTFLGRDQSLAGYRRVFEIEGALEVDENNFIEIERTRVYFDDVLGITYHRETGWPFLIGMGLLVLLFAGLMMLGLFADADPEPAVVIVFGILGAPFLLALIVRLILKVDVVTVFGQRTMACMKFSIQKERARRTYRDLTVKVRAAQEKASAAQKPPPPPPAEVPLPPPELPPPSPAP